MSDFAHMAAHLDAHREDFPHLPDERSSAGERSRFYSASTLQGKPVKPRDWLVHGLIPMKTVTLFSGDGGTGKSLLSLQLAVAVATGRSWIGKPVCKGGVIFMSAEDDDDELHRRLDDILRSEGRKYEELQSLTLRSVAGEDALLATDGPDALIRSKLFKELDERAAEDAPSLIVIDTLADVYPANENDRAKVRQFISMLRGLALKYTCTVLLLAHPSLTGMNNGSGLSGSTGWNNSVRGRLYLQRIKNGDGRDDDANRRRLTNMKQNYAAIGAEITMRYENGVFVADQAVTGLDALAANAKAERVFLTELDEYTVQGRHVSHNPGPTYAPAHFAQSNSEGMTKHALRGAMERLFKAGKIRIATHGRASKERKHIERTMS